MITNLISEEQKAAFDADGVLCIRGAITAAEVELLREATSAQLRERSRSSTGYDFEDLARQLWTRDLTEDVDVAEAERFDMDFFKSVIIEDPQARPLLDGELSDDEGCFLYEVAAWQRLAGVRQVAFDSRLAQISAELLDARYVNFWEDTTFVKAPRTRQRTAFHQDLAYFQIEGDECVIVWIPLDEANEANGTLEYVRGSHKWGETYAPNMFITQTPMAYSPHDRCPDIEANRDDYDIVSFDVSPGDVIIHHVKTIHGAGGNPTDTWRRAMSFRYCGDQVRYYDRPGAIPQTGVSHALKDGDPLFARDYPIVWPKPWPEARLSDFYDLSFGKTEERALVSAA